MKTTVLAVMVVLASRTVSADKVAKPPAPKQPAIPSATAALIPDAGWLVATQTDDQLVITRITKTGPKELLRASEDGMPHMMWIDPKTLVHVTVDFDKNIEVKWIVEGAVDAKRTVKHKPAVWGGKSSEDSVNVVGAYRAADGGIWLERCTMDAAPDCTKSTWLRVDTATTKAARGKPAKLTAFRKSDPRAPAIKAPAGYSAKLVKIKSKVDPKRKIAALECTGPKGTIVWSQESPPIDPAERYTPKTVRWILASPPLVEIEGEAVNPVGQTATVAYVFRECRAEPYNSVTWIGDHAWSYDSRDDDNLHILVDDVPVAVLVGHWLLAAPSK